MKRVEFNPKETKTLKIEFECCFCGRDVKSRAMEVPALERNSFNNRDYKFNFYRPACESCQSEYDVSVCVNAYRGFVDIETLEKYGSVSIIQD